VSDIAIFASDINDSTGGDIMHDDLSLDHLNDLGIPIDRFSENNSAMNKSLVVMCKFEFD
jgi:hypothetical protein